MARGVDLYLLTDENLLADTYGQKLLTLMFEKYSNLAPEYACFYGPCNKPIPTVDAAMKYWVDDYDAHHFTSRRRSSVKGRFGVGRDMQNAGWMNLSYSWNKKINWYEFFLALQECIDSYFGYVHFYDSQEKDIGFFASFEIRDLGIPDLGWGTFFGKRYLDRLPLDDLKQNGFTLTPQGDGYLLTMTDKIDDVVKDYGTFEAKRELAKSLFPEGFFHKYK